MLRTFGGRAAAAPVVLPLAMLAARLSISRRHGTNSRGRYGYTEQAMSRWTNSLNSISIFDKIRPRKSFFTSLLNLIFRNNSENACLVIHLLTNQMQIKLNSIKKNQNSILQVPR